MIKKTIILIGLIYTTVLVLAAILFFLSRRPGPAVPETYIIGQMDVCETGFSLGVPASPSPSPSPSVSPSISPSPSIPSCRLSLRVGPGPSTSPSPSPLVSAGTGDLNGDNQVNTLDWSLMKLKFGAQATLEQGDLNLDGMINTIDWSLMKKWFGKNGES